MGIFWVVVRLFDAAIYTAHTPCHSVYETTHSIVGHLTFVGSRTTETVLLRPVLIGCGVVQLSPEAVQDDETQVAF
jgi:hypothetical protein